MKQETLKYFDLPWLPIAGLVIFVACFLSYVYWTYRKDSRSVYDEAAQVPLNELPLKGKNP